MPGWSDQIRDIGHDLVNIEINTIEAEGMLGRKMPVFTHALIDIAQKYGDYLGSESVRLDLDAFADKFAGDGGLDKLLAFARPDGDDPDLADRVRGRIARMRIAPVRFAPGPHQYSFNMTNGPNTFELLRWAARRVLDAAEKGDRRKRGKSWEGEEPDDVLPPLRLAPRAVSIIRRIYRTSDQLKTVCLELYNRGYAAHIGQARWQLLTAPEPDKTAPTEMLSRIRKAWDIGVDHIVMQTVIQLDGDVVFRGSSEVLNSEGPLFKAHESLTAVGLKHWGNLFNIVIELLARGARLFGGDDGDGGTGSKPKNTSG